MKVKVVAKLPDGRIVEVVAEPEMLDFIAFGDPENPVKLEDLEVISIEVVRRSMVHPEQGDEERDVEIEILKQRLPPKFRANFDNIFVDKKKLDSIKHEKKQRRSRSSRSG